MFDCCRITVPLVIIDIDFMLLLDIDSHKISCLHDQNIDIYTCFRLLRKDRLLYFIENLLVPLQLRSD